MTLEENKKLVWQVSFNLWECKQDLLSINKSGDWMLEIIKNKIWGLLKDKEVSLVMIFHRDGEILWHRCREILFIYIIQQSVDLQKRWVMQKTRLDNYI